MVQLVYETNGGVEVSRLASMYERKYGVGLKPEHCGLMGIAALIESLLDLLTVDDVEGSIILKRLDNIPY